MLSTIVLEMGGSSDLCTLLQPGEPVILMGPTGTPTETPGGETVLLAGGGLGNAVLFSIGQALRAAGSRVLYFAGYKRIADRYKVEEIETRRRRRGLVLRRGAGLRAGAAAGPQPSSATSSRRWRPMATGELGPQRDPAWRAPTASSPSARTDDGGGGARRGTACSRPSQARPPRHRLDQLADAMHDEGDLRPVPAGAEGPGDRRGDGGVLLLQPGPAAGPRRFPRRCTSASARTRCRRSSPSSGSTAACVTSAAARRRRSSRCQARAAP